MNCVATRCSVSDIARGSCDMRAYLNLTLYYKPRCPSPGSGPWWPTDCALRPSVQDWPPPRRRRCAAARGPPFCTSVRLIARPRSAWRRAAAAPPSVCAVWPHPVGRASPSARHATRCIHANSSLCGRPHRQPRRDSSSHSQGQARNGLFSCQTQRGIADGKCKCSCCLPPGRPPG